MTEIFKAQTFPCAASRCMESLAAILPKLGLTIQSQSTESRTLIGHWTMGTGRFTVEARLRPVGENSTEVTITYRPDLTPALNRPYHNSTVQAAIRQKLGVILGRLAQSLGMPQQENPDVAVVFKRTSQKWQWFDWLIFFGTGLPVFLLTRSRGSAFGVGLFLDFGFGVFWWALYTLTLRRLWARLRPELYTEWVCANCNHAVPSPARICPNCRFKLEEDSSAE